MDSENYLSENLSTISQKKEELEKHIKENEKKLDCLDYLIYKIRKEKNNN